jgi:hypothetical protein
MPGYFFPLLAAPVLQVVIYSNTDLPEDEFRAQTEKLRRVASYDNATRSLVRPNSLRPSRMGRRDAHGPLRCRPPPQHRGLGVRLSSAVIAAMAAPMIFELPFDLIVMARTYPPSSAWPRYCSCSRSGAGRIRLPVRPHPHRHERGVEDPRVRHGAQPVLPRVVHAVAEKPAGSRHRAGCRRQRASASSCVTAIRLPAAGCRPPGTCSGRAALDGETGYGGAPWIRTSAIG